MSVRQEVRWIDGVSGVCLSKRGELGWHGPLFFSIVKSRIFTSPSRCHLRFHRISSPDRATPIVSVQTQISLDLRRLLPAPVRNGYDCQSLFVAKSVLPILVLLLHDCARNATIVSTPLEGRAQ